MTQKQQRVVGGGGTSLAVVVVWLSKDAWFAIVDTFLFPATKALSDPSGATIHDGMATEAKHTKMMVIVRFPGQFVLRVVS